MRRTGAALILMVVRARGLLPSPLLIARTRPSASRTHEVMASYQLTDLVRRIPGRLLAGFTATVTGWRAKHDGSSSSCDLLFDDDDHAATWYVCKQQPQNVDLDNVSCTMLDEPGFGDEPGFADPDARWICKTRKPGVDGWGEFEEVDPNFALRWLT